jgi:hypothetical protein
MPQKTSKSRAHTDFTFECLFYLVEQHVFGIAWQWAATGAGMVIGDQQAGFTMLAIPANSCGVMSAPEVRPRG